MSPIFSLVSALLTFAFLVTSVSSISCYVCSSNAKNLCSPLELYGNETQCASGITVCYKSWSVEADPKTIRRCGKRNDIPNSADCRERLQEADKVLVCKCDTDLCNGGAMLSSGVTRVAVVVAMLLTLFSLA